ncbi:MAG: tctex1 protein 2 [Sphingomonadales bacterium]|nr:tctex1 protein 2 [Sphingomonadales bacterium]
MKGKDNIAPPARGSGWTRPEDYLGALARRRSYRRAREGEPRPTPPTGLSTVPLAAILAILAILVVAITIVAFPGNQPPPRPKQAAVQEQGVAQRGWFQEAQKSFHH